jgi:hypothetical protein
VAVLFFEKRLLAFPAAMSRGDFELNIYFLNKRQIPQHCLSVPHRRDMPSSFQLKRTKKLRLPNLCSFHHGKSFERNPSRGKGSASTKFLHHFCGLLMFIGEQRKFRKIYRAPIQTFRGRTGRLCWIKSAHIL